MRDFADFNPVCTALYYIFCITLSVMSVNSVILSISLAASLSLYLITRGGRGGRFHLLCFLSVILSALINAAFVHRGETVLLVINDKLITAQALLYGFLCGIMIASSLYFFASFSRIFTGDRLMYIFSFLSPGMSMLISMALRFVPHLSRRATEIRCAVRGMGDGGDENFLRKFSSSVRTFSALCTWSLENSIITAQSMECRGYGLGRRSSYRRYPLTGYDIALSAVLVFCFIFCFIPTLSGALTPEYYPSLSFPHGGYLRAVYSVYGFMAFVPVIIHIEGDLRWKYFLRKI